MATDITQNPFIMDTAEVVTTLRVYVKTVRWVGGDTAGDQVIIHDNSANVKWVGEAAGANHVEEGLVEDWWDGVDLDTIASGIVYLTLG